ncbi:hypothetical protein DH2020_020813 [Rehmannia glutinosa]|uniref:Uncharacterized protein n=1 Tax=Rehmannia glutinosa TaxID=99300 RepID=A0ABR0W8J6_REHGL
MESTAGFRNGYEKKEKDYFHVIHKVPSGDGPYVRAKHAQLVQKDPEAAIVWFWKAINAGDRVDSALKDMAVVMKQLDRTEEAIEAVKSFRRLCPRNSQESLDNVLFDLYKLPGSDDLKSRNRAYELSLDLEAHKPTIPFLPNIPGLGFEDDFVEALERVMNEWAPTRSRRLPIFEEISQYKDQLAC